MTTLPEIDDFLSQYDDKIVNLASRLREVVKSNLPNSIEQLDIPARMIAYCYGQKYADLVCVIIPSKKGLKLGFNGGVDLPDPDNLLEGTGKISRYVQIRSEEQINSEPIKTLLQHALAAYRKRVGIVAA